MNYYYYYFCVTIPFDSCEFFYQIPASSFFYMYFVIRVVNFIFIIYLFVRMFYANVDYSNVRLSKHRMNMYIIIFVFQACMLNFFYNKFVLQIYIYIYIY